LDRGQTKNLAAEMPEKVTEMLSQIKSIKDKKQ